MNKNVFRLKTLLLLIVCCYNIYSSAQEPVLRWAGQFGGRLNDYGRAIAVDNSGNVYTTGTFMDTADFDPGPGSFILRASFRTAINSSSDIYISKLDSSGNFVWAQQFTGSTTTRYTHYSNAIDVDDSGNVYSTGRFQGTVDFDPGIGVHNLTPAGSYGIYISKLHSDGTFAWAVNIGPTEGLDIKVGEDGDVYVCGRFTGTHDFDPGPGVFNLTASTTTAFIMKLKSNGEFVWAKAFHGVTTIARIALDETDNIYTANIFSDTVDIDPGTGVTYLYPDSTANLFVLKLDSAGNFQWAKQIGGDLNIQISISRMAVDKHSSVYITGTFQGTVDFNPDPVDTYKLTVLGTYRSAVTGNVFKATAGFVFKLDSAGAFQWAGQIGGNRQTSPWSVAVEASGKAVYLTGAFYDTTDFDPDPLNTYNLISTGTVYGDYRTSIPDIFITKLDGQGNFMWARQLGSAQSENAEEIRTDKLGNLYITGNFQSTVDFDPDTSTFTLTSPSNTSDAYVLKLFDCIYIPELNFISGIDSVCPGNSVTYSVTPSAGATYIWELPNGWIGQSTTNSIDVIVGEGGTLVVQAIGQCDTSIISLNIVHSIEPVNITVENYTLGTTPANYDTYQWLLNGTTIPGANGATHDVTENGIYCIAVTKSGCTDTACYTVTNVHIENTTLQESIQVYPNPANNTLNINSPEPVHIVLTGVDGRSILRSDTTTTVSVKELANGVYFLHILDQEERLIKVEKVIKQ